MDFCAQNHGLCAENDGFVLKIMDFMRKIMDFALNNGYGNCRPRAGAWSEPARPPLSGALFHAQKITDFTLNNDRFARLFILKLTHFISKSDAFDIILYQNLFQLLEKDAADLQPREFQRLLGDTRIHKVFAFFNRFFNRIFSGTFQMEWALEWKRTGFVVILFWVNTSKTNTVSQDTRYV